MIVKERQHAVPGKIVSAMPCTGPAKRGQSRPARRQSKSDIRSTGGFRLLGENEKIEDFFEFGKQLYGGGTAKVWIAKKKMAEKQNVREYVVKVRMKKGFKDEDDKSAWHAAMTQLMACSVCPNVLEIQEIFEDQKAFYVVMPKCSGGELYDFLIEEVDVPLKECKRIIQEILVSLSDIHSKGLIHRDVKPENIMFDKVKTVKLIDFDTCRSSHPNAPKPKYIQGTPGYIAPEVLIDGPSPKSDLFAVGVILFILMTGEMPWPRDMTELQDTEIDGANANAVYKALRNERIDWNDDESPWPDFPCAADLCRQLMAFDQIDRPSSATEALNHPWFKTKLQ